MDMIFPEADLISLEAQEHHIIMYSKIWTVFNLLAGNTGKSVTGL